MPGSAATLVTCSLSFCSISSMSVPLAQRIAGTRMSPKGSIRQAYSSIWVNWVRSMCLHSPRGLPQQCSSPRAMTSRPRPSYVHHALRDPKAVFVAAHGEVGIGRALHLHTGLMASHVDDLAARRGGE